jgi:hypothetical protein
MATKKLECAACGNPAKCTNHLSVDGRQLCPRCWSKVPICEVREMIRKRDAGETRDASKPAKIAARALNRALVVLPQKKGGR